MKKFLIVILSLSIVFLSACSVSDSSESLQPSENSETTDPTKTEDYQTEKALSEVDNNLSSKPNTSTTKQRTVQSGNAGNDYKSTSISQQKAQVVETTTQEATMQEKSVSVTETEKATVSNAGTSDTRAVAEKVLKYINQYRSSPAIKLSGLTSYAQYRSKQLVHNFAHDTDDQRTAATALQYGEYIDPSQFGASGNPYYRAGAREAIVKSGFNGTVDQVAENIAKLVRDSSGHWAYIGSSEYKYIAVGVTYQSGMWYCDIAVATENTDEY